MSPRQATAGVGLVELMVALALGLFTVLVGTTLLLSQLREQHRRLSETRLRQEMRAVLAFVEHDLRRAGLWGAPAAGVWAGNGVPLVANPYGAVSPEGTASAASLAYTYSRDTENHAVDSNERFGLRLNATTGVIEARIGDAWQALTDPQGARFTTLSATARSTALSLQDRCSTACATGATDCPPRQTFRTLDIVLAAQAPALPALQLRQQRAVHLPTDVSSGRCPA
jgi:type IV pilus assembly protein PilW